MIKRLFILLLFLSSPALADPIHYSGGTSSGTTAVSPNIVVLTTNGGVSVRTKLPDTNLVYAMIPEAIHYLKDDSSLRTEFHCDGNAASDPCGNESGTTTGIMA